MFTYTHTHTSDVAVVVAMFKRKTTSVTTTTTTNVVCDFWPRTNPLYTSSQPLGIAAATAAHAHFKTTHARSSKRTCDVDAHITYMHTHMRWALRRRCQTEDDGHKPASQAKPSVVAQPAGCSMQRTALGSVQFRKRDQPGHIERQHPNSDDELTERARSFVPSVPSVYF